MEAEVAHNEPPEELSKHGFPDSTPDQSELSAEGPQMVSGSLPNPD